MEFPLARLLMSSKRRMPLTMTAILTLAVTTLTPALTTAAAAPVSTQPQPCVGAPLVVTPDCTDPLYSNPVIDAQSEAALPVPHHRVSGHFEGTDIQFTIYLPAANKWQGRFFQWTYPTVFTPGDSTAVASDRAVGFALTHGGYAVQAGNGSVSLGYRHAAAAAKFAESFAKDYYGYRKPIRGYLYGGSGGSFQTLGAAEDTQGVWDGFVPYIMGTPMSTPYTFFIRSFADLVLADDAERIRDAVSPGGSGDPYAGLDAAGTAMLTELTKFGVPLQAWEEPDYVLGHPPYYPDGLLGFGAIVKQVDPSYVQDFWNTPGYLGTEQSPLGDAVRAALAARGDTIENRWDISLRGYYRYQLPATSAGYVGFDQFRSPDGTPLYPQRKTLVGPLVTAGTSGNSTYSGKITAKMLLVDNLYDSDALPFHADWYKKRVQSSLGESAYNNNFRLYYTDHADHQEQLSGDRSKYAIEYWGVLEQALVDVSAWVEKGTRPPASTNYLMDGAQVRVPDSARQRAGLQPTVDLTVRNGESVEVKSGQQLVFRADAHAPKGTGKIVAAAWDVEGDGSYVEQAVPRPQTNATVQTRHRFDEPGTYYVALRVTSQRSGVDGPYTKVQNIDRVKVVVTACR